MSDDGVYWADKNRSLDEKTGTKDAASEFLPYLVENEVPIYVCPPALKLARWARKISIRT